MRYKVDCYHSTYKDRLFYKFNPRKIDNNTGFRFHYSVLIVYFYTNMQHSTLLLSPLLNNTASEN